MIPESIDKGTTRMAQGEWTRPNPAATARMKHEDRRARVAPQNTSPSFTSRSRPTTTVISPYFLTTFLTSMMGIERF